MTYIINTSDQNPNKQIFVLDETLDGTLNPFTCDFNPLASNANLSITLYGKDQPNYGEKIQENLLYLLDNFSSNREPAFPLTGQTWNDRSLSPNQLRVYNNKKHVITSAVVNTINNTLTIGFGSTDVSRWTNMIAANNNVIMIFNSNTPYNPITNPTIYETFKRCEISSIDTSISGTIKLIFDLNRIFPSLQLTDNNLLGWYVGGWEYVLQNNAPLRASFNVNNQRLYNIPHINFSLTSSSYDKDAVNKLTLIDYVAQEIANHDELSEMFDVSLSSLSNDDLLTYNSTTGKWENKPFNNTGYLTNVVLTSPTNGQLLRYNGTNWVNINVPYLSLSGGTMTGNINFNNTVRPINVPDPINNLDAANKQWVQTQITTATSGSVTDLNSLTDVVLTSVSSGNVLRFDGTNWVNANLSYLPLSGGTLTGPAYTVIGEVPTTPNQIVNKGYVDFIQTAMGGAVAYGSYESQSGNLNLLNSNSSTISILLEDYLYVIRQKYLSPQRQVIITTTNSVLNYSVSPIAFRVGFNQIDVYVNGVKFYQSTHGRLIFKTMSGFDIIRNNTQTGLSNDFTTYSFDISINGAPNTTISLMGVNCQSVYSLLDEINSQLSGLAKVLIGFDGIEFYSNLVGTGSSISITDIDLFSTLSTTIGIGLSSSFINNGITLGYSGIGNFGSGTSNILLSDNPGTGKVIEINLN